MRKILFAVLSLVSVATVGCGGADNVNACNDWKAAVKCGSNNIDAVNCDAYANTSCDISAYFDCLKGAYVCVNGMYDHTKMGEASKCVTKATCK